MALNTVFSSYLNRTRSSGFALFALSFAVIFAAGCIPPKPFFGPAPGPYDTTQYVTFDLPSGTSLVYYTLDGSTPTDNCLVYDGSPIEISSTSVIKVKHCQGCNELGLEGRSLELGSYRINGGGSAQGPSCTQDWYSIQSVDTTDCVARNIAANAESLEYVACEAIANANAGQRWNFKALTVDSAVNDVSIQVDGENGCLTASPTKAASVMPCVANSAEQQWLLEESNSNPGIFTIKSKHEYVGDVGVAFCLASTSTMGVPELTDCSTVNQHSLKWQLYLEGAVAESSIGVSLPPYPVWSGTIIEQDARVLDELAAEYAAEVGLGAMNMPSFLYGWLPAHVLDIIIASPDPVAASEEYLWLFHLSGYFGGVWLRGELDSAQPGTLLSHVRFPPSETAFKRLAADTQKAYNKLLLGDASILSFNDASFLPSGFSSNPIFDGVVDNFGYNQGYMLQILEDPPAGLITPPAFDVVCSGALSCQYATPKLQALAGLQSVAADLNDGIKPAYTSLAAKIQPVQDSAELRGRNVWNGYLSVQGFPQNEYELLLDLSSGFLQNLNVAALLSAKGVVEDDVDTARKAVVANTLMTVWLTGYASGLPHGRDPNDVPVFEMDFP